MDIIECSLAELVDDPLVHLVMKSDGVNRAKLKLLLKRVARERLGATRLASHLCPLQRDARNQQSDRDQEMT